MDEKLAYRAHPSPPCPSISTSTSASIPTMNRSRNRPSQRVLYFYLLALLITSLLLYHIEFLAPVIRSDKDYVHPSSSIDYIKGSSNETSRVALEAHVMSKCSDARDCLRDLVVPAMEKIGDKVDFQLSFIGEYVHHNSKQ